MGMHIRRLLAVVAIAASVIACAGPSTPEGTQVLIRVVDDTVVLTPAVVPAGTVHFVVEAAEDPAGHSGFDFVSRLNPADSDFNRPPPLLDGDVERLRLDSSPQGMGHDGGWGSGATMELRPGEYVFMVGGGMPGTPPESVTVLTVTE